MRFAVLALVIACGASRPVRHLPSSEDPEPDAETEPTNTPTFPRCENNTIPDDDNRVLATFERTLCHGRSCAEYRVAVFRDGLVLFVGRRNVMTCEGIHHLDAAQVVALERLFTDASYLSLADAYESWDATHYPTIITSYSPRPGVTKRIRHYRADRKAPHELTELEDAFEQLIDIERFIGTAAR